MNYFIERKEVRDCSAYNSTRIEIYRVHRVVKEFSVDYKDFERLDEAFKYIETQNGGGK